MPDKEGKEVGLGVCAFCDQTAVLRESHILPAFVYRWLRGRSGTGHMRNTGNPNMRVQDGIKLKWLCDECEGKFSRYETAFVNKVFNPWNEGNLHVKYEEWLLKFCVSISWRIIEFCYGRNKEHSYTAEQMLLVEKAKRDWKSFLRSDLPNPGLFEQHLLILDNVESTTIDGLPNNFNRFITGAVTFDIIGSKVSLMTFAKLGRFIIIGIVQKGPDGWKGTKVNANYGTLKPGEFTVPYGLLGVINDKADQSAKAMRAMSSTQKDKIEEAIINNPDRFVNSDQFASIEADIRMFGLNSFVRKD